METIDISLKDEYPSCALSTLNEYHFVLDGIECASMEGFLQSLKIRDVEDQRQVCRMVGADAKIWGSQHSGWKEDQTLYWLGKKYYRHSDEYLDLVLRAFFECSKQNNDFVKALLATGEKKLTHSIGKKDPFDTILTEDEFCLLLTKLRFHWKNSNEFKEISIIVVLGLIIGVFFGFFSGNYLKGFCAFFATFGLVGLVYFSNELYHPRMKLKFMKKP